MIPLTFKTPWLERAWCGVCRLLRVLSVGRLFFLLMDCSHWVSTAEHTRKDSRLLQNSDDQGPSLMVLRLLLRISAMGQWQSPSLASLLFPRVEESLSTSQEAAAPSHSALSSSQPRTAAGYHAGLSEAPMPSWDTVVLAPAAQD